MADLVYLGSTQPSRSSPVFTASGFSIGTAYSTRRIVVVMSGTMAAGRNVSSATIGGVSATIHMSATGNNFIRAAFSAIVTSGTTADIVITMSDSVFNDVRIAVYSVDDNDLTDGDNPNIGGTLGSSDTSVTVNYTAFENGPVLLFGGWENGSSAKTPVTTSPTFVEDYPNDSFNGAHRFFQLDENTADGATSVTVSWSGSYTSNFGVLTWAVGAPPPPPAFPTVVARGSDRTAATNTTSHPITIPTHAIGDLILVHFAVDGNPTVTVGSGSGWTKLGQESNGTTVTGAIFWKIAESTGETLTLTSSATEQSSHTVLVIRPTTGYEIAGISGSAANGSSTNSNPPNHAPGVGEQNFLWIVTRAGDSTVVATAAPANYTNLQTLAAAGTGGASTNTAERQLTATSEDPGTFTSNNEQWACWTIAIWQEEEVEPIILAALNSVQTNESSTGAIGQTHSLAGQNSAVTNEAGSGSIIQQHLLAGSNSESINTSNTGAIVQTHLLAGLNSEQANEGTSGEIGQVIAILLEGDDSEVLHEGSSGPLSQTHILAAADSSQSSESTSGAIIQLHVLAAANSEQGSESTDGAITQIHILEGAASEVRVESSSGAISQEITIILQGSPSESVNEGGSGQIIQSHLLAGSNSEQVQEGTAGQIIQTHWLGGLDSKADHASSDGAVGQTHLLQGSASQQDNITSVGRVWQTQFLSGDNSVVEHIGSAGEIILEVLPVKKVILTIQKEHRMYKVLPESRIYQVPKESRIYKERSNV